MPRRPPPTPLRLVNGPLPPRSRPKYTLPLVPRPTFFRPPMVVRGPAPRTRQQALEIAANTDDGGPRATRSQLLHFTILAEASDGSNLYSADTSQSARGPWDHHR